MPDIRKSLEKLQHYIEVQDYKGWDPYDILKSPLFKLPLLNKNKTIRFYSQQFGKRFPVNIRALLLVPKGTNPVTLGLCIQAYSYLSLVYPERKDEFEKNILSLITKLKQLIPSGFSGACWGYDFYWEARNATIPSFQPTIVATGIITNGLFECYRITNNIDAFNLCKSACDFVLKDLNRTGSINNFCFSYSPFDRLQVFNASMKGVRLLSQVYSITKNTKFKEIAGYAAQYVIDQQNDDGSWFYSKNATGSWIDNYHTGYLLDCLDEYMKGTGDNSFSSHIVKGFGFYKNSFFEDNLLPKFYNTRLYPIDCTSAGQSLLTLCRYGEKNMAQKLANWMITNMQADNGYFYFRKFRHFTEKTSFMRWSNAWMLAGLSGVLCNEKTL
jgi:rhamnogalacturonyl hydrolase YesR